MASGLIVDSRIPTFSGDDLPLVRLARILRTRGLHFADFAAHATEIKKGLPEPDPLYDAQYTDPPEVKDPRRVGEAIGRYLTNKRIAEGIAASFHTQAYFVWQPSPLYKYDLKITQG